MKTCPYCSEQIQDTAKKCRYCGEWLEEKEKKQNNKKVSKCKTNKEVKKGANDDNKSELKTLVYEKNGVVQRTGIIITLCGIYGFYKFIVGDYKWYLGILYLIIGVFAGFYTWSQFNSKLYLSEKNIRYHKQPIFGNPYDLIIDYSEIVGYNPGSRPLHEKSICLDLKNGDRIYVDNLCMGDIDEILQYILQKYYENRLGVEYKPIK